jgi:chromosome segregation protein
VQVEEQMNHLKVGEAKYKAEKESFEMELTEYSDVEIIKASMNALEERLQKTQASLQQVGSINLRALEIYEEIKQEYDRVQEKVTTLLKEKEEILKIVEEIDNKKRRTFMKTYNQINELFSRNFMRLSSKGQASLELENPEDLFAGGVSIAIRLGRGKYFDVTSLSGGEQTLVALSLLFAIQEFKPYHFYVLDEIDAALDKRNAEKLSVMLKQYMQSGQYITVTHNDALILDANVLYGVSMHEGISKILSLKAGDSEISPPK